LNSVNPALVTQRAAQRLPRPILILFCAAYVLPGLFGRDPWKSADITAFGYMVDIARGATDWLAPKIGGLPSDAALLPYWLGAVFIKLFGPWLGAPLAARVPFALLLLLTFAFTWYTTYHLARTEAAQPLAFAFGGEAAPIDYARAIADGSVLALIATLGLLQLGHETTPELGQLASVVLYLYGLAASPFRGPQPKLAVLIALPALAASGAPAIAVGLGIAGTIICWQSSYDRVRRYTVWVVVAAVLAVVVATWLHAWGWRLVGFEPGPRAIWILLRQLAWFCWPAWVLAVWTLWRWRGHLTHRHLSIPWSCVAICMIAWLGMDGFDRALMLALPPLAVLAAFALPTFQRSTAAAIDWFSVFFFSLSLIGIWFVYVSMQTGVPPKPAANIERLAPGYPHDFSAIRLAFAVLGTIAWMWLVRWRTGRNRHPLWKSLVIPAGGVAVCWLLVMTLLLPPLNHARSYRSLVERIGKLVPPDACVAAPGMPKAQVAALEYLGGYRVDAVTPREQAGCPYLLLTDNGKAIVDPGSDWNLLSREKRNAADDEITAVYSRRGTRPAPPN
jgi:4-amino-4-deoxy-L-arabinose transferase-like glycosyltransferase